MDSPESALSRPGDTELSSSKPSWPEPSSLEKAQLEPLSTGAPELPPPWLKRCRTVFRWSIATLPYGFYGNLVAILVVAITVSRKRQQSYIDPLTRGSLIVVSGSMILSAIAAIDQSEAILQLVHFLPFFWLFTTLPVLVRSPHFQVSLARDTVLASIPISGIAIIEYSAKNNLLPEILHRWGIVQAWHQAPHIGRAMVMFDHPNVLAHYTIILLGLSMGLLLNQWQSPMPSSFLPWIWTGTILNLISLFCSGSRNGILVGFCQLLLLAVFTKLHKAILVLGSLSSIGFGIAIAALGLGLRPTGITQVMDDPRIGIWKIALDLIYERPWLGWGPGSFKFLYPSRLIDPAYQSIFHTHNLWLLLAVEYGIPVMLSLTTAIGFICYRAVRHIFDNNKMRHIRTEAPMITGYILALLGTIQFSLIDVTFYDARLNLMTWLLLSVLYGQSLNSSSCSDVLKEVAIREPSNNSNDK